MPIYEYYCPDNHRIYQFYAKTLAQGRTLPRCPDNPKWRMEKLVSRFAVTGGVRSDDGDHKVGGQVESAADSGVVADDARMEAAMGAMEREFASVDENDPRAVGRMMRRMSELTGEKIDGEMEEVVRKLEEGTDPESLEDQLGGADIANDGMDHPSGFGSESGAAPASTPRETRARHRAARRAPPTRDPKLHDFE
jgi:hypothetical protein